MTQTRDVNGLAVNASVYTAIAITDHSLDEGVTVEISVDLTTNAVVSNMTVLIDGNTLDSAQSSSLISGGIMLFCSCVFKNLCVFKKT